LGSAPAPGGPQVATRRTGTDRCPPVGWPAYRPPRGRSPTRPGPGARERPTGVCPGRSAREAHRPPRSASPARSTPDADGPWPDPSTARSLPPPRRRCGTVHPLEAGRCTLGCLPIPPTTPQAVGEAPRERSPAPSTRTGCDGAAGGSPQLRSSLDQALEALWRPPPTVPVSLYPAHTNPIKSTHTPNRFISCTSERRVYRARDHLARVFAFCASNVCSAKVFRATSIAGLTEGSHVYILAFVDT